MKWKIIISLFFALLFLEFTAFSSKIEVQDSSIDFKGDSSIIVSIDSINISKPEQIISEADNNESIIDPSSIISYISFSKIISILIVLVVTYLIMRFIAKILSIWAELNTKHRVTIKGIVPILKVIVWSGVIVFIIGSIIKPPMATILAFGASAGVAVGFASQDLLKNIFGGIVILIDRPFKVGDKVKIGDYYGEIIGIGLRSTRLVTPDDNLVSVPNAEIMNQSVANANAGEDNCQVVTDFYLPLDSDVESIKPIAVEAASVSQYVFLNKPIVVLFKQETIGHKIFLRMRIKAYVNDPRQEFRFASEITEILTKELYIDRNINLDLKDENHI
jgi:small-conductance mechanosensitive channel